MSERDNNRSAFLQANRPAGEDYTQHPDSPTTWHDRMERKLDKLSEAVIEIVRLDERMITLFNRQDRCESLCLEHEKRIHNLEVVTATRAPFFSRVDTVITGTVAAMIGALIAYFLR